MAENVLQICRICLEQLDKNEHFHFLNNDNCSMLLSKTLDFLPELDLDCVRNPISCNQCAITIDQIHELKKLCIQTESILKEQKKQPKSFNDVMRLVINETEIVRIKEEFVEDKFKDEYTESVSKICRICLEELGENMHFNFLTNDDGSMLLSKLLDILPEIDLDLVENPISCNQCTIKIDKIHEFKKLCVQTESIIKDFQIQQNDAKKDTIKEESLDNKYEDELLIVDNNCLEVNTDLPVCIEVPIKLLFYCYTCDYTTYNKKILARHMNIHHLQGREFKCSTTLNSCSLIAHKQQKNTLKAHRRSHIGEKRYKCNDCDYRCYYKSDLRMHTYRHTKEKRFKCDICDYGCNRKSILNMHIRTHTGEKPYKCTVCDYRCNQLSHLKRHMHTHTIKIPYKCNVCNYWCNEKMQLNVHICTHTGEKPYKCDVCDYRCNHKSNLKKHILSHTGEKPYKCDVCDFHCNHKPHLKVHIYKHTGDKLYKCDVCDYRCNQKWNLQEHIRMHTGEKPYKCDICDYRFSRKSSLNRHTNRHPQKTKKDLKSA